MANKHERNKAIWAEFVSGGTVEQLSSLHGLTPARLRALLKEEELKQSFSPEVFYRSLRQRNSKDKRA